MAILFLGRKVIYSAKKSLLKDQAAWSGKDIKIKYRNSEEELLESKSKDNFLKIIAEESKIYLEDQSNKEEL
tara:strand:+ start:131 stop:346 length:216 start_codon:yes stop_codon:yes gene_type:complete